MNKKHVTIAIIFTIIFVIVFCFLYNYKKYANPTIDIDNCISVHGVITEIKNKQVITEVANCINSAKKRRMIFPSQTLHSPTMILSFYMKDGTHESIWFYGEYVLYKPKYDGIQYRFDDVYSIYEIASKYHLDE